MKNKLTNEEIKNPPPKCDSCLEFEKTGKHYDNCQRNDHNFFEELLKKISPTKEDDKKVQEALGAKDIEDFFSSHLTELLQSLIVDLEGEKKEYPPNLKQEIWGGEGGFPNTKIESPDMFGIKYVDGFNSALSLAQERIRAKLK